MLRTIRKTVKGTTQYDGAGVKLVRVIGNKDTAEFDPFLMLDAFDSTDPDDYTKGFPWHPHRGIETVTYLIKGDIEHGDSIGNKGSILDGCCQWMTAGSGIMHQEMPKTSDRMLGVQLWLNLPRKDKMTAPAYRDIRSLPVSEEKGCKVRILSGNYKGTAGAVQGDYVKAMILDAELEPGARLELDTDPDDTVFVYIVGGGGSFEESGGNPQQEKSAVLFTPGDSLTAAASPKGMRFLLFAGPPLKEPVAWGGPIVMNTRQELELAFSELKNNTFIK